MTSQQVGSQTIIVTGVTSGIGKACAEHLMRGGHRVYGGARRVATEGSEVVAPDGGAGFIRSFPLDVTDPISVEAFVGRVVAAEGGVGTVVHAAGYVLAGAVEDVSPDEALDQFATNVFGTHHLLRAVLPVMRRQGNGRLIIIGSVAGFVPVPFQSMYSASKYALEALTEATRMEVLSLGIKVTLVDPGDVRTEFTGARRWAVAAQDEASPYRKRCLRAVDAMVHSEQAAPGPEIVVRVVDRVLRQTNPPVRVVVGAQYKLVAFIKPLVPQRLLHWLLLRMYG